MSLKLNSSGGGSVTLQEPSTASNRTLTLPDNTGTLISTASTFAGTGPAFSAYLSANQTVSSGVLTKLTLNTEVFDTNNCFDSTTNFRFTPTTSGYYQVSLILAMNSSTTAAVLGLYKNGSVYTSTIFAQGAGITTQYPLSALVYLNGSTDYLEFYGQTNGGSTLGGGATGTLVSAALVRAA